MTGPIYYYIGFRSTSWDYLMGDCTRLYGAVSIESGSRKNLKLSHTNEETVFQDLKDESENDYVEDLLLEFFKRSGPGQPCY